MQKTGQIFSLDFIMAFSLMILSIGLTINFFETGALHAKESINRTELWNYAVIASDSIIKNPNTMCELIMTPPAPPAHIDFLPNCIPETLTVSQDSMGIPKNVECEVSNPSGAPIAFNFADTEKKTGFFDPATSLAAAPGLINCTNLDGILISGDSSETICQASTQVGGTDFGFTIPGSATINGIEVRIENKMSGKPHEILATLDSGGTPVGTQYNSGFISNLEYDTVTLGGPNDLWGTSWTPATINVADFGVRLEFRQFGGGRDDDVFIDNIDIKITYTGPSCSTPLPVDEPNFVSVDRSIVVLKNGPVQAITKRELMNCQKRDYIDDPSTCVLERSVLRLKVWKK